MITADQVLDGALVIAVSVLVLLFFVLFDDAWNKRKGGRD